MDILRNKHKNRIYEVEVVMVGSGKKPETCEVKYIEIKDL